MEDRMQKNPAFYDKWHLKEGRESLIMDGRKKSMSHTIHYNPDTHIIEIKVQGTVVLDELKKIYSQSVQLAKEKECFLVLSDFRETNFEMSTMDLYSLPHVLSEISESQGIKANRLRRAIVIDPKDVQDASFAEDVTANQGQHAKFFLDMGKARKWLIGK